MKPGELKKINISKLVYGGYGLGFLESTPVFVSGAVPGDDLEIVITRKKSGVFFAEIARIIGPSSIRIDPDCAAFPICGGCDWLNLEYRNQLKYKKNILEEIFRKYESMTIPDLIAADNPRHYRNKSFLPLSSSSGEPVFGMYESRSHNVVPHDNCLIQPGIFDNMARQVIAYIKASGAEIYDERTGRGNIRYVGFRINSTGDQILAILVTRKRKLPFSKQLVRVLEEDQKNLVGIIQNINPERTNVILTDEDKILAGQNFLYESIGKLKYKVDYRSFFQVNSEMTWKLYEYLKDNTNPGSRLIDAYCGVGAIGLYVADKVRSVVGMDSNSRAIEDARHNMLLNGIENCDFLVGSVESELDKGISSQQSDTIIFDPPRKGLNPDLIDKVISSCIRKIIYVSCNPTTQLRDIEIFLKSDFRIVKIQAFDMFPQTYHLENVVILER